MDYSEVLKSIKQGSLFDLYRLSVAISHEMENPERIRQLRNLFKEGDVISYFDYRKNGLVDATVLQKNPKNVSVLTLEDKVRWKIPYYALNFAKADVVLYPSQPGKLSRDTLKVGDCVGFNYDGTQIVGIIKRLNQKSVTVFTTEHKRWRVGYRMLFKVLEGELANTMGALPAAYTWDG